jgi:dimethylaniline monooxygenase (N-oxide forming)
MESRADLCSGFGLSFLVQTDNTRKFGHQSQLEAPIMHSIDFVSSKILAAEDIGYVAVLGAGRSAADMVYACLNSLPHSTQIHWIVREEGTVV